MSKLENKIDFVVLVSVDRANCNGDPLNGNRPRMDYDGFGEMSDVCIKRKIRNRMQDMGESIFVQSEERCNDGFGSLSERAASVMNGIKDRNEYAKKACEIWTDVRTFGQVFAFDDGEKEKKDKNEKGKKEKGVSVGVRGPVSIHPAFSVSKVEIESQKITKSVSGAKLKKGETRAPDTMGMKHRVRYGLYQMKGSVSVQLAEKTGFSVEDAELLKECLRTLFVNDASAARPEGSMEVVKLFWFRHNCRDGQYSTAKVHRSVKVKEKDTEKLPSCVEDYEITLEPLEGLTPEILNGI